MPDPEMLRLITGPMVRRTAPAADDAGVVVRPIGPVVVTIAAPTTATHTIVAASVVTVVALAANAARLQAFFQNNSASRVIYLRLGAGAAIGAHTVRIGPRGFYEIPFPVYTGLVTAVWGAGVGGDLQVTELT